jgi:chloramphenicol 3-O phosphotransferase
MTATRMGRIIFLTGPSSAGKSTLAAEVQKAMATPFLRFSSDHLAQALDPRRTTDGPFAYWSSVRPRFFTGFHRSIAALAGAGNDLIVDHLIEFSAWRDELRELLSGLDVFLVGVHCSIEELERRERARGDRRIGEAREHVETDKIHNLGGYDLEVDSCSRASVALALDVVAAWELRAPLSVLFLGGSKVASINGT